MPVSVAKAVDNTTMTEYEIRFTKGGRDESIHATTQMNSRTTRDRRKALNECRKMNQIQEERGGNGVYYVERVNE